MYIALINNNEIVKLGEHTELFSNVSFSSNNVSVEFLLENSCMQAIQWLSVEKTQKLEDTNPYIQDGKVYTVRVLDKSPEELQQEAEQTLQLQATEVRNQRNQLLKDSDWTQVADAPVDKAVWAVYRQALRDITLQAGFPFAVDFPVAP